MERQKDIRDINLKALRKLLESNDNHMKPITNPLHIAVETAFMPLGEMFQNFAWHCEDEDYALGQAMAIVYNALEDHIQSICRAITKKYGPIDVTSTGRPSAMIGEVVSVEPREDRSSEEQEVVA